MGVQEIFEFFGKEGQVILQAPVTFGLSLALSGLGLWAVLHFSYKSRLESADSRIQLRDDQISDYKDKLSGATPEEAKKRIEALELKVQALSPRRLDASESARITKALSGTKGFIYITQDVSSADAKPFSADLSAAFHAAGWVVKIPILMGIADILPAGLGLRVTDPNNLRPIEQTVRAALIAAGLNFDLCSGPPGGIDRSRMTAGFPGVVIPPGPDLEIVVTTKAN